MIFEISKIEEIIGYEFKDKELLRQCFTHASYANMHNEKDNEILEFFGDAIIQFIVTEYLVEKVKGDEGDFTKYRALIVSKEPLQKSVKKGKFGVKKGRKADILSTLRPKKRFARCNFTS